MVEEFAEIVTPDGIMPTFIAHPGEEKPAPAVLILMDGRGIREALRDVARRLAGMGYYATLPDLFYRAGADSELGVGGADDWDQMISLVQSLSDEGVTRDIEALVTRIDTDPAIRPGAIGLMGFCMGGRLSVILSQALGERVAAAAAIHPGLTGVGAEAAHLELDRVAAEFYFAIADRDQWCSPEHLNLMEKALERRGTRHEIEHHPGALHGFGVPGGDTYHEQAAERVWEKVDALFARRLD
ncbi:MAG: dienelactone hydrolase family protein [bacterium]|nr:dienelactone hydrolase family protein [bacterium]